MSEEVNINPLNPADIPVVILSGGVGTRLREASEELPKPLVEIVNDVFGGEVSFGENGGDNRSYRVSFEKISNKLPGFECQWDAVKGAQQLHDVFSTIDMDGAAPLGAPTVEVVAIAKRDLVAGSVLDGLGGYDYYGVAERADVTAAEATSACRGGGGLPSAAYVAKDEVLTYADIELPKGRLVDQLRLRQAQQLPVPQPV